MVSAWNDQPVEIFSQDERGEIHSRRQGSDGNPIRDWTRVHNDSVDGRPIVERARHHDGRVELFVLDQERIKHCFQDVHAGALWSDWDTLGHGENGRVESDPTVAAHSDGRFELFARGGPSVADQQLFHCWLHPFIPGYPLWSNFEKKGTQLLLSVPSACHRSVMGDQIIVVAADKDGRVMEKHQVGPEHFSCDWTEWSEIAPESGSRLLVRSDPVAFNVTLGSSVHILAIVRGEVHETIEQARSLEFRWAAWQALPSASMFGGITSECRLTTVQTGLSVWLFGRSPAPKNRVLVCEHRLGVGWMGWQSLGGNIAGDVAAGIHPDGRIEAVARPASGDRLMSRRQVSPSVW